jgi:hypothetical protein
VLVPILILSNHPASPSTEELSWTNTCKHRQKTFMRLGDCVEMAYPNPGRRPIEAVWYTGKIMGKAVAQTICNQPTKI